MKKSLLCLAVLFLMLTSFTSQAAKIDLGDGKFINFKGYWQFHFRGDPAVGDAGGNWNSDWYIHRTRIMVGGKLHKNINFFLAPLWSGIGKDGDFSGREMLIDAWVEFDLSKAFKINIGNLKLPFSWHMQQSGASLHSLDFHGPFISRGGGTVGHRDQGALVRGLLVGGMLDYRFGILDGADGENDAGNSPRFVGRLGVNLADALDGYFLPGTMLGKKKIMSMGVSFDIEPYINAGDMFYAFAFDALFDIPMGKNGLIFQGSFYYYSNGAYMGEGMGFWADAGYRIGSFEPLVGFEMWVPGDDNTTNPTGWMNILPGLSYWLAGHTANLKLQFGMKKMEEVDDLDMLGLLQFQILYN